ncbi:single-stranded DNA cytosine deaminase-like [Ambystoma mexicanum]|uniref:single-stranded DNA cytosine deaminase-like n=1 Tax=Ambystoma mexicanum TaxID=8296 RepID=UPI0037E8D908
MPLNLRERVSLKEFQENFCNTTFLYKTLLCFSLKERNKNLWELWGYAYNNPQGHHAESLALKELQKYINEKVPRLGEKCKITFYISYSPCYKCCAEISWFLSKNGENLDLSIKCAKPYKWNDKASETGLRMLNKHGASIKIMDKGDYEEGFYLFVDPVSRFEPWPELELISMKYTQWLQGQLREVENNCSDNNIIETNLPLSDLVAPMSLCNGENDANRTVAKYNHCTPEAKTRDGSAGTETPQKSQPTGEAGMRAAGVKRKLFDISE